MKKENITPITVLTSICITVAILLALVNMITAPVIDANTERAEQESLIEVMPGADAFDEVKVDGAPETVSAVYKERSGLGHVVLVKISTDYTQGIPMSITVGIGTDGKITGIKLTAYSESKDFGKYPESFIGLDAEGAADVDTVTGVTYSSRAFKTAVADAFKAVILAEGGELPPEDVPAAPEWDEEKKYAEHLIDGSELSAISGSYPEGVKRVWVDKRGGGYAALVKTKTQHVDPDTVTVVAVGNDGKIIGIKILTWAHGEGIGYTEEFVDCFAGVDSGTVDGVDSVTGATGTADNVKASVKLALGVLDKVREEKAAAEELIDDSSLEQLSGSYPEGVIKLWKDTTGAGYVALVNTKTEYVDPDTSTLVAVGADGKVIGIKILTWAHGENIGYTDAFVGSFAGKDEAGIDGIDAVTGATGTANNVKSAVKLAFEALNMLDRHEIIAESMLENSSLKELSGEYADGIARAWADKAGGGYAVLVKTKTQYVDPDTETLVIVGSDGKVKSIKILTWAHGENIGYTDAFVGSFAGKDEAGIDGIDAVTGATGTANNVKSAVKLALSAVKGIKEEKALAESLIQGSSLEQLPFELPEGVKKAWADSNGGGYVLLVNTKTEYVDPDTSTLVAVGADGKVIGIKILTWAHGENIGYTDEFVGSFAGKGEADIDGIDAVTGATGTANNIKSAVKLALSCAMSIKEGGN